MTTPQGNAATLRVGLIQMRSGRTPRDNFDAAAKLIRSRCPKDSTAPSARSPIPRLGTLRMRRSDTSSSGLASARR